MKYLYGRRKALGGYLPKRTVQAPPLKVPALPDFARFLKGDERSPASTTKAFVLMLSSLLRNKEIGRHIVPIIPDEARTFGMDGLFREIGIYSPKGQLYESVDSATSLPYYEAKDGQILEEGINEAGSIASFTAAGTAYATHGVHMIPFYIYYSMFGFQRIGDLMWLAGDIKAKGFLLGATSGRTTHGTRTRRMPWAPTCSRSDGKRFSTTERSGETPRTRTGSTARSAGASIWISSSRTLGPIGTRTPRWTRRSIQRPCSGQRSGDGWRTE